jgi:hypothetical protein
LGAEFLKLTGYRNRDYLAMMRFALAAALLLSTVALAEDPPPLPMGDERREIGERVQQHMAELQECYESRLRDQPHLQGRLVAQFDIGPAGEVIAATADGMSDAKLVSCVVQEIRSWHFSRPASGGKLRVRYPLKFVPLPDR